MFIDKVIIEVQSGKGGDGAIAFRREKYIPNGGPNGGDGGRGGSVIMKSTSRLNNLGIFRYERKFSAPSGENGSGNNRSGKDAEDIVVNVPVGTVVFEKEAARVLFDFTEENQSFVVVKGGRGGNGNQHYATATRQTPNFAKPGDPKELKTLVLELKTLADVGLVGLPNVGKSTLLSVVSNANPKIANYHFTTISPNLGIVKYKDAPEFVMCDIPGLIEGASGGAGLGHTFLRHVERTRLLVHIIDASSCEGRDPKEDYEIIQKELNTYKELSKKPMIIALGKIDLINDKEELTSLKKYFETMGKKVFTFSGATREGVEDLLKEIITVLPTLPTSPAFFEEEDYRLYEPKAEIPYTVTKGNGMYYVQGPMIKRLMGSVNFSDYESRMYFDKVLTGKGVYNKLRELGLKDGDTISIEGYEFEYIK